MRVKASSSVSLQHEKLVFTFISLLQANRFEEKNARINNNLKKTLDECAKNTSTALQQENYSCKQKITP